MLVHRVRGLLVAALTLLAFGTTTLAPAGAVAHGRPHHHHHRQGIPQHNGGDRDADNNGGPSDGDGNL